MNVDFHFFVVFLKKSVLRVVEYLCNTGVSESVLVKDIILFIVLQYEEVKLRFESFF